MADEIPWLRHLPEDAQREFYEEILQISVLSKELGESIPDYVEKIQVCLASWRATAEVYADPELKAVLTTDHGFNEDDFVEAEPPDSCCLEISGQCGCTDSNCCLKRSVCDHAESEPEIEKRARALGGYTPQLEIRDEIQDVREADHGE